MKSALLCFTLLLAACAGKPGTQKVRLAVGGIGLQMYNLPITLTETLGKSCSGVCPASLRAEQ